MLLLPAAACCCLLLSDAAEYRCCCCTACCSVMLLLLNAADCCCCCCCCCCCLQIAAGDCCCCELLLINNSSHCRGETGCLTSWPVAAMSSPSAVMDPAKLGSQCYVRYTSVSNGMLVDMILLHAACLPCKVPSDQQQDMLLHRQHCST